MQQKQILGVLCITLLLCLAAAIDATASAPQRTLQQTITARLYLPIVTKPDAPTATPTPTTTPTSRATTTPTPTPQSTATATPTEATGAGCDPSYPTVCIPPPPPDLDCGDIPYRRFTVRPPDPHNFDRDHDGIGCET
ncbi:MAG: hypothetical protein R3C14_46125 [Caldilineaceae bacterium]